MKREVIGYKVFDSNWSLNEEIFSPEGTYCTKDWEMPFIIHTRLSNCLTEVVNNPGRKIAQVKVCGDFEVRVFHETPYCIVKEGFYIAREVSIDELANSVQNKQERGFLVEMPMITEKN